MNGKSHRLPRSPFAIRVTLLRLGITLTEASKHIGVTHSMISQVLARKAKSKRVIDGLRELIRMRKDGKEGTP